LLAASHPAGRYESTGRNQYENAAANNTPRSPQSLRTRDTILKKIRFHDKKNQVPDKEAGAGIAG
jgi:hypothetical protein